MKEVQTKRPYVYGGTSFATLGALKKHLSAALDYNNRPVEEEFFDLVLAEAVHERHYRLCAYEMPTSFKFMRNTAGDGRGWGSSLAAFIPGRGWIRFSTKQVYRNNPWSFEREFSRVCRERWALAHRDALFGVGGKCSIAGCEEPAADVDHVRPLHREIVAEVRGALSPDDEKAWEKEIKEQGSGQHFGLPEGHPVTEAYDRLTRGGAYQLLCKHHHWKKAK